MGRNEVTPWQQTAGEEDDYDSTSDLEAMGVSDSQGDDGVASVSTSASQKQGTTNYLIEKYPFKDRLAHYTPGNVFDSNYERAVQAACNH